MYRHRQLHLWITDHDYRVLRTLAKARQETLSSVIRRLIKSHQDPAPAPTTETTGTTGTTGTSGTTGTTGTTGPRNELSIAIF